VYFLHFFYKNSFNIACFFFSGIVNLSNMNVKSILGTNIRHYRKQANLSQEELAEKADISVKHLSVIERGVSFASADLLGVLACQLGVPLAALFCTGKEQVIGDDFFSSLDAILSRRLSAAQEAITSDILQSRAHD
jgi:transcriptional regulator with XRE-family HTH domain